MFPRKNALNIQLFRERHKSVRDKAESYLGTCSSERFFYRCVHTRSIPCTRTLRVLWFPVSKHDAVFAGAWALSVNTAYIAKTPSSSLKQRKTTIPHNTFRHCQVHFNIYVGQPFSLYKYISTLYQPNTFVQFTNIFRYLWNICIQNFLLAILSADQLRLSFQHDICNHKNNICSRNSFRNFEKDYLETVDDESL